MKKKLGSRLVILLLLSLLVRLSLVYFQYSGDLKNHLVWARGFLESPTNFYFQSFPGFNEPNYPPLAIYFFGMAYSLWELINESFIYLNQKFSIFPSFLVPLFDSENMIYAFLKIPGILADLVLGYLIYYKSKQLLPALLYLFNPAVIYLSSVWGQIEPITSLFLVSSILFSNNSLYSVILFVLGILTKQTVLWFLPIMILIWFKKNSLRSLARAFMVGSIFFYTAYLPFGLLPAEATKNYLLTLSGSSDVVSDAAWNIWHYIYGQGASDATRLLGFPVRLWSITLLTFAYFVVVLRVKGDYLRILLWSFAVFFLQTRVHERHLAYSIPLFLMAYPNLNFASLLSFVALSLYHLLNLVWSLKLPFVV